MRILAGRYKGRSIKTISSSSYRPTQSRIRKSLFDILGPLDAYLSLTSMLGVESLVLKLPAGELLM